MSKYSYEIYLQMLIADGVVCCTEITTTAPYFNAIDCDCEE